MTKLKHLSTLVERVLAKDERARGDDVYLTLTIIKENMPDKIRVATPTHEYFVSVDALYAVREDNVKRIRARLQNDEGKYLPADPEIRRKRRIREEQWLAFLGKNPEMISPESEPTPKVARVCPECGEHKPDDNRVKAGMKCGSCAYGQGV